jgi:hypothetical protein
LHPSQNVSGIYAQKIPEEVQGTPTIEPQLLQTALGDRIRSKNQARTVAQRYAVVQSVQERTDLLERHI